MRVPQMMPWVGKNEYKEIASCFSNNWITEGPKAKEFSEKLLQLIGARFGVFAPNGTLALYLGLKALGVGYGDEVIVPDFTFIGSATAVEMTGATPTFVDVNKRNFQIDLKNADSIVTKHTKAIMPVHIYGTVADMKQVIRFAKKRKLKVIEDAAEAIGVHREGTHAGSFSDVGCFSFFADKTITTAEGGFVVTSNEKIYKKLLYIRNQGRIKSGSFIHPEIGYNLRITDIQCAVGLAQLKRLPEITKRKHAILNYYKKLLKDVPQVLFFKPDKGVEWIPFRFPILVPNAVALMEYLKKCDIEPRSFFYPLHRQPCFSYLKKTRPFPNAVYGYSHGICLPIFPTLTKAQIKYICNAIKEYFREK